MIYQLNCTFNAKITYLKNKYQYFDDYSMSIILKLLLKC